MTVHVGDLKARAERARRTFEESRAKLFRADGKTKIFGDAEHAERLSALRAERNRALGEVEAGLREAFREANAQLTNLEHRDPTELLSPQELALANQKRGFALDAAEALDTGALVRRLEAVLAGGEKGSIFAYWMGGQKRRERILERRRENARRASDHPFESAAQIPNTTELDDVLGRMHEALDGGRTAAAIEAARERLGAIATVEQIAYLGRNETSSVYNPRYSVTGG